MDWLNEIQAWFTSVSGSKIFLDAILPFVAIVLAGIIAASIGRESARRVIEQQDRQHTGAAVVSLIVVGRKAALWSSLGADEKQHIDSLMSEADIRVRLLPVNGSSTAADWAAHELTAMKKNSASFSFQAEQSLIEYRDRLLNWQAKPRRAKKLFLADLEQWRYEEADQSAVVSQQQQWANDHVEPAAAGPAATVATAAAAAPSAFAPTSTPAQTSTPAPTTVIPALPAASAPATGPTATGRTATGSTPTQTITPGLADAAPPTVAPMDAPAPTAVTPTEAAIARANASSVDDEINA